MKPTLLLLVSLTTLSTLSQAQCPTTCTPANTHTRATIVNPSFTHLQMARAARKDGKLAEMWRQLDRSIKALPQDREAPVARQLRNFLATTERHFLRNDSQQMTRTGRVEALLGHARQNHQPSKAAAIIELLVREPHIDTALQKHARHNTSSARRLAALAAIDRRPGDGNRRFVLRTAVVDRSKTVRQDVLNIVRTSACRADVDYLAAGLGHRSPKVRMRAAQALGNLGHHSAIDLLVKAGPVAAVGLADGGATTRAHVAFLRQKSYIRDFDVEVASAAFVADPKIDVLQEGSVLDATVMGVTVQRTIRRYYRRALKQLSGKDPGKDVTKWAAKMAKATRPSTAREELTQPSKGLGVGDPRG